MSDKLNNQGGDTFLQILLGLSLIFMFKSLFENDNSKIVSKKGSQMLSDDEKMKELHQKLKTMDSTTNEVVI